MNVLCYIDTETTGLDPRIHQPYEVCIWREDWTQPNSWRIDHTLEYADRQALKVGGYFERGFSTIRLAGSLDLAAKLATMLNGVTLVGSNPAFDAAMLTRIIGTPVWHHRMIDISNVAMVTFGLDRPPGLAETTALLRDADWDIPEPDHTAEGDVRTTKAVYEALRAIRADGA